MLPRWLNRRISNRASCVEQLEHRLHLLPRIFVSDEVLPLEQEAERKGGVLQSLADHFAKIYKVCLSIAA